MRSLCQKPDWAEHSCNSLNINHFFRCPSLLFMARMPTQEAEIAAHGALRVINKIEGPGPIRAPQTVKRTGKAAPASGTSFAKQLDEAGSTQGVSGSSAVGGVLGIQEVDDALAHASRGKARAQDILDRLEDLRMELLLGTISKEKLLQLSRIVNARRAQITDPRLQEVLDEIDLRAQVELAKYGHTTA